MRIDERGYFGCECVARAVTHAAHDRPRDAHRLRAASKGVGLHVDELRACSRGECCFFHRRANCGRAFDDACASGSGAASSGESRRFHHSRVGIRVCGNIAGHELASSFKRRVERASESEQDNKVRRIVRNDLVKCTFDSRCSAPDLQDAGLPKAFERLRFDREWAKDERAAHRGG